MEFAKTYIRICNATAHLEIGGPEVSYDIELLPGPQLDGGRLDDWCTVVLSTDHPDPSSILPNARWIEMVIQKMSEIVIVVEELGLDRGGDLVRITPQFVGQVDPDDQWQRSIVEFAEGRAEASRTRPTRMMPPGCLQDPGRAPMTGIANSFVRDYLAAVRRYQTAQGRTGAAGDCVPPEPGALKDLPVTYLLRVANPRLEVDEGCRRLTLDVEVLDDVYPGDGRVVATCGVTDADDAWDARTQEHQLAAAQVMTYAILDVTPVSRDADDDLVRVGATWTGRGRTDGHLASEAERYVATHAVEVVRLPAGCLDDPVERAETLGALTGEYALDFAMETVEAARSAAPGPTEASGPVGVDGRPAKADRKAPPGRKAAQGKKRRTRSPKSRQ